MRPAWRSAWTYPEKQWLHCRLTTTGSRHPNPAQPTPRLIRGTNRLAPDRSVRNHVLPCCAIRLAAAEPWDHSRQRQAPFGPMPEDTSIRSFS